MKPLHFLFLLLFACKPDQRAPSPPVQPPPTVQAPIAPVQRDTTSAVPPGDLQAWFALPDTSGKFLVCMGHDNLGPGPFYLATLDGHLVPLSDLGIRTEGDSWSHRDISRNFWEEGGHLFGIPRDSLVPDRTYLVVSKAFLDLHHPVHVTEDKCAPLDSAEATRLTWTPTRRVRTAWSLGRIDSMRIAAVQYVGMPPLAALVVSSRDSLLSARYPGGTSDSESVWRVEDGGQFDGCRLGLIAAFRSAHGIEIAHSWGGPEGDYDVLLQQSADTFTILLDGSRYWNP